MHTPGMLVPDCEHSHIGALSNVRLVPDLLDPSTTAISCHVVLRMSTHAHSNTI